MPHVIAHFALHDAVVQDWRPFHAVDCVKDTLCFQVAQGVPAALVALTVGIAGAFIAWRQYATARAKLKLDLFERRYEIFMAVWTHLSFIKEHGCELMNESGPKYEAFKEFRNNIPQSGFLFGRDIERYLSEINQNQMDLWGLEIHSGLRALSPSESVKKSELTAWFDRESRYAKVRFKPYLDLRKWK